MIAAGLGFRPACEAGEIAALLAEAARRCGRAPSLLAVPWFRDGATAQSVADGLGLPVAIVAERALRDVQSLCPTRSARALAAHGIGSVAEGCALAAAGAGARLLLLRIGSGNATCAVAEGDGG